MPQRRLLGQWYEDFAQPGAISSFSEKYTKALATVIRTKPQLVVEYFKNAQGQPDHRGQDCEHGDENLLSSRRSQLSRESYSLTQANSHLSSNTLALVDKYVSSCRRRRSQNDGRRSVNTGPFRCTFGCGYRTKRAFDWRRHEETHEPQELWLCTICSQRNTNNPFLVNRKDKFLKHASDKHAEIAAEGVLDESRVPFVPRAEWSCIYCGLDNESWDERCRHVLAHFEDEVERSMKRPRVVQEERENDEPSRGDSASVKSMASSCDANEGPG
ncbi:hypothetical protein EK21DRAFT_53897 [Setomelanomma holmii]|uniref:C2H2-type domain-containing protein n=1 Tax=Setomelanomma holmii TaxID=210430 RepID=A0A9P4HHM8_9PLEO|nr:hypothetical protein EK21DRAFT_53897 [Setomelanomma holmii]